MDKKQAQAKLECQQFRCSYYHRCKVHWGKRCTRQGGQKVPRFVVAGAVYGYQAINHLGR